MHLRVRVSRQANRKLAVFIIHEGSEILAEPRIQQIFNHEFHDHADTDIQDYVQLHAQHRPPWLTIEVALFTVEFSFLGWQYMMDSRDGITQWFVESIPIAPETTILTEAVMMEHEFLQYKLVPVMWKVNNLLVCLQRAYMSFPFQDVTSTAHREHYIVNILLNVGSQTSPNKDAVDQFSTHFVSGHALVADVFNHLVGENVDETYTLVQFTIDRHGAFHPRTCLGYFGASVRGLKFRDVEWVGGEELWLLPCKLEPFMFTGMSAVDEMEDVGGNK